jgi:hypothetical protein
MVLMNQVVAVEHVAAPVGTKPAQDSMYIFTVMALS